MTNEQVQDLQIKALQSINAFYRNEIQLLENGHTTGIILQQFVTEDEADE